MRNAMREHAIFHIQPGRVLRGIKDAEVPNVIASGLKQLQNPLLEYNKLFRQLQQRRRELPLTDPSMASTTPGAASSTSNLPTVASEAPLFATALLSTNTEVRLSMVLP